MGSSAETKRVVWMNRPSVRVEIDENGNYDIEVLDRLRDRIKNVLQPALKQIVKLNKEIEQTASEMQRAVQIATWKNDINGNKTLTMMKVTPEFRTAELKRMLGLISDNNTTGATIVDEIQRIEHIGNQIVANLQGDDTERLLTLIDLADEELKKASYFMI